MAIPESIKKKANQVRNEVYGKDVREALASGIEEAGDIADQANTKSDDAVEQVDNIQAQVDQLVVEGDSSVEAAQARVDAEGKSYPTLKARLDAKETEFSSQLAQKANMEQTPVASSANVDYYVSITGDDSNPGTSTKPFATINQALSKIPDMIRRNHVYTIHLGEGEWNEELVISNKLIYGELTIQGTTENRLNHKVIKVYCEKLIGKANFLNITTTTVDASGPSFEFSECTPHMYVKNCEALADPLVEKGVTRVIGLLADYGSQVYVEDSHFPGKRYGIRSNYLSRVFSKNNTGDGNSFGVGARWGGIVSIYGTNPTGDIEYNTDSGGIIGVGQGGVVGIKLPETGLIRDAVSLKEYLINANTTGHSEEIGTNMQIRMRFKRQFNGMTRLDLEYGGQSSLTSGQYAKALISGIMRETDILIPKKTLIDGMNFTIDDIIIQHVGSDGLFDVIVRPLQALSGYWGINLSISTLRHTRAPQLQSVTIESRT